MHRAHHTITGEKTSLLLLNLTTKGRDSRHTVRLYQEFTGGMVREQRSDRCKKGDGRALEIRKNISILSS